MTRVQVANHALMLRRRRIVMLNSFPGLSGSARVDAFRRHRWFVPTVPLNPA
ncbi:hypothetical protein PISMIDRAFT_672120 [Pisolithus microcarpus 441]|uniref:Uncharacterized protein n=1 Tax=Pisolithus microcarpus 441 TaxID=765257 RepID=A0A0D0A4X8_9AGAM|nr:hypothetical protein PISMIDRAFT_672120 [Pisolithus microcarpus 441]